MDTEYLRYQIQKIDDKSDSLIDAVKAMLEALKENDKPLPKSVEHLFFEEATKATLDWMGKGMNRTIRDALSALDEIILPDPELAYPLAQLDPKKRFAAMLSYMGETMSVYLRSDLESKDHQRIMDEGKVHRRLRKVMAFLYEQDKPFQLPSLSHLTDLYPQGNDTARIKAIQRDLTQLEEYDMIQRQGEDKPITYRLGPKAYFYKEEILKIWRKESTDTRIVRKSVLPVRKPGEEFKKLKHILDATIFDEPVSYFAYMGGTSESLLPDEFVGNKSFKNTSEPLNKLKRTVAWAKAPAPKTLKF